MRSSLKVGFRKGRLRGRGWRGKVLPEGSVSVHHLPKGKNLCICKVKVLLGMVLVLVFLSGGCSGEKGASSGPFRQTEDQGLVSIEPKKPTRITLRRNVSGKYSWELKGEDPAEIMEIDSRIREYIDGYREKDQKKGGR